VVRDDAGRSVGTLRGQFGELGFAHLRLEAAAGPLTVGGAPLTIGRPAWLAAALEAA
jgi:hypothetical protein